MEAIEIPVELFRDIMRFFGWFLAAVVVAVPLTLYVMKSLFAESAQHNKNLRDQERINDRAEILIGINTGLKIVKDATVKNGHVKQDGGIDEHSSKE